MVIGIFFLVTIIGIVLSLVTKGAASSGGNRNSHTNFNHHTNNINHTNFNHHPNNINSFPVDNQNQLQLDITSNEISYDTDGSATVYSTDSNENNSSGNSDSSGSFDSGSGGGFDSSGGGSNDSGTNNNN